MRDTIQHKGIISTIDSANIEVKIIQATACSSCSAKGFCSSSESKEKFIDIPYTNALSSGFEVGDAVLVVGESRLGLQAVLLAFVIPFVIVISSLFLLMNIIADELYAAAGALLSLIPYYLLLWLFRGYMKEIFTFKIKPIK